LRGNAIVVLGRADGVFVEFFQERIVQGEDS
jgi:hypothetical protein